MFDEKSVVALSFGPGLIKTEGMALFENNRGDHGIVRAVSKHHGIGLELQAAFNEVVVLLLGVVSDYTAV